MTESTEPMSTTDTRDAAIRDHVRRLLEAADAAEGLLPIVEAGDPVLRMPCAPVDGQLDDAELNAFADAMQRTMRAAPGVGLAAPQVGVPLRMFVAEDPVPTQPDESVAARLALRRRVPFGPRVVLNAEYSATTDRTASFFEGCLSIPGYQAVVDRPLTIGLTGQDLGGAAIDEELTGWPARIVAHESDHLDGVLYLDAAQMRSLATNDAVARWWGRADTREAAAALGFEVPATSVF
ncbi:peptide deformylase [Brevibacterium sp. Mu109]|uniref:peptide deformylase n=1 Tax=Brevibacterium sp. Mu109 TaxID=1255669 RepID=UPI000C3A3DB0|nr:peptide deformylase [Brevibacterium sp. Mu109]SMX64374.1 peptide deformylase [Brevibacterium sp. Mu109]